LKNFDSFFILFLNPIIAFYLILDVAVGGTNGWFPDNTGDKPWLNGAISGCYLDLLRPCDVADRSFCVPDAMQLFAQSQDKWSKSWPQSEEDRAMRVYVFALPCMEHADARG
jgi:hypothetical protein